MKLRIVMSAVVCCGACAPAPAPVVPRTAVERQMAGLLQKFDLWDEDGDGELDQAEIARGLKGRGASHTPEQVVDFYDTSGNGKISLHEAQAGLKRVDEVGIHTRQ